MYQQVSFHPLADDPSADPAATRLGGQPHWLEKPRWPVSASTGLPMDFIGQFRVERPDEAEPVLAYVFMADFPDDDDDDIDDDDVEFEDPNTFEVDGGDNAVIVQPGGRIPEFVKVGGATEGPMISSERFTPVVVATTEAAESTEAGGAFGADGDKDDDRPLQQLGGPGVQPVWLQGEEEPGADWELIAQLDSCSLPFEINFGDAGVGYAFLAPDRKEGRFLWQCC